MQREAPIDEILPASVDSLNTSGQARATTRRANRTVLTLVTIGAKMNEAAFMRRHLMFAGIGCCGRRARQVSCTTATPICAFDPAELRHDR
jgi:hypothetical protein